MKIYSIGPNAFIVDFDTSDLVIASFKYLRMGIPHLFEEVILGADTIVIKAAEQVAITSSAIAEMLNDVGAIAGGRDQKDIEIPTVYDGLDLDSTAALAGLTVREVIDLHCAAPYTVSFLGFAPGFAYLVRENVKVPIEVIDGIDDGCRLFVVAKAPVIEGPVGFYIANRRIVLS